LRQKYHKIRITLTSRKVQSLEKVCRELIERANSKDLKARGPVRLPTKALKITTRKTPWYVEGWFRHRGSRIKGNPADFDEQR